MSSDAPLRSERTVTLGRIESDVAGFEVIRYQAPIVLVKAVDGKGNPLQDFRPKATYRRSIRKRQPGSRFLYDVNGDIFFQPQQDGRWRSSQVLPDEDISLTVELDGYTTTEAQIKLAEAEEREFIFVLKPK